LSKWPEFRYLRSSVTKRRSLGLESFQLWTLSARTVSTAE
jgi:hypothetical protein